MSHNLWKSSKETRQEKAARLRHLRIYSNSNGGISVQHHDNGDDEATESHEFSDAKSALAHLSRAVSDHFATDEDHDEADQPEYKADTEYSNEGISEALRKQLGDEVRTAKATRRRHDRGAKKAERKHQLVFTR